MCLLVVSSPNSTPRKKDLDCASCNNPHGFGYAVIAGDKIITGKGMSAKKVIKEFLAVRKQYPKSYAMYHARFATHGVKNDDNCHPFKIGGSCIHIGVVAKHFPLDVGPLAVLHREGVGINPAVLVAPCPFFCNLEDALLVKYHIVFTTHIV